MQETTKIVFCVYSSLSSVLGCHICQCMDYTYRPQLVRDVHDEAYVLCLKLGYFAHLKELMTNSLLTQQVLIARSTRSLQSYCRNKCCLSISYEKT